MTKIHNHFNFSFTDFISAVGMVMFMPSEGMIAAQAAGLLYSGLTKVTDDSGVKVDKTFLIDKIQVLQGDIDNLKENFEEAADTGTLKPDDAEGTKFVGRGGPNARLDFELPQLVRRQNHPASPAKI
jgi:hypothetical protein